MRARASELATEWLGPRTEREIEAALIREVTQERWTSLDAAIRQELKAGLIDVNTWTGDARLAERAAIIGRLNHLSTMGLAEKTEPGVRRVSADAPEILRAMGERGDIVRTLQRAMGDRHQAYQIFDPARASVVTGRIVSKGLHDELGDRGYVIVDGLDGRAHYAVVAIDADIASLPVGAIVDLRGADTRSADRAISATAQNGIYRSNDHLRELRMDPTLTREPGSVVQAHVRRLEALRRAGVVERLSDGIWKIPQNLPEQGRAHDLNRLVGAIVDGRCHLPIEQQTRAVGATWLDQQLVKGSTQWPK